MNTSPENEFAELRRLLRLKRHEQPPPGYFHSFSKNVISALDAQQSTRRDARSGGDAPAWILNLMNRFQARPALAGAFGAIVCAGFIGGVVFMEKDGTTAPMAVPSLLSEITPAAQPTVVGERKSDAFQPMTAQMEPSIAETNLQLSPGRSLFDTIPGLDTVPVGDFR